MAASVRRAAHDVDARKRTDDVLLSEGLDFGSLLLSAAVLDGLSSAGFRKPSPIQLKAIPLGRCGLDLIVQAKSGTGKTCVFCTVALDSLVLENPSTQVLVLAPTREIAVQIHGVVMAIGCTMEGLECHVFIGGRPVSQDKAHLKRCHVAVGSPGRIKQLIELGMLSTSSIRLFVLDEADKLLEEGSFQEQINWIFSSLPLNKQMLALSATYPESLAQHLTRYMREPTFVRLNPGDMGLKGLKQYYKLVPSHPFPHKIFQEKVQHLLELFSKIPFNQALVFSNLHTRAQHLADILSSKGLPAACISGGLSQDQRLEAMSKLKQYQCRVLISTDLTSRGIDAEKVNLVINLDVPQDWETYMHRIGRAGRFGTQGLAVTYCCHGEEENKMMAIAQKCGLTLSPLPLAIGPGLMDEPCDWDVCTDASAPGAAVPQPPSRTQRKKKPPQQSHQTTEHSGLTRPDRNLPEGPAAHGEGRPGKASPAEDAPLRSPAPTLAAATRRAQQDALPKIPPLSSFKGHRSGFVTLEEAEQDFYGFITAGEGRSVEVIREFGGGDDGDGHRESFTLSEGESLKLKGGRWTPNLWPPRAASGSSSSLRDEDTTTGQTEEDQRMAFKTQGPPTPAASKPKADAAPPGAAATADTVHRTPCRPETAGQETRRGKEKPGRGRSKKTLDQKRDRDDDAYDDDDEEEDWSPEAYWRASFRAWNNYYASMSPFQERGPQSYYSAAHDWMAAYRMNAVYMEELLRR
ncbi:probable ATP-dependent RNA helicase DDX20 [Pungitius pungitius]|uniref:probable ATP-dependent RNA helicase DDX20 n=1 Tax=Pungitius pungitius TaxID=134920 RepID=UPI002E148687